MAISALALKVFGVGVVAVPTVGLGIAYRNEIGNFFSSQNQNGISSISKTLEESLLNKLKNSGLKFTADKPGEEFTFSSDQKEKSVKFSFSPEVDGTTGTWECTIKFKNTDNTNHTWNSGQKDIFTKANTGFLQKLTSPGNDYESDKERFIKECSKLTNTNNQTSNTFTAEKAFELSLNSSNLKANEQEFNKWFKNSSLEESEKTALNTGNLTFSNDAGANNLKVSSSSTNKPADCIIVVPKNSKTGMQETLKQKINPNDNTDITEDHKKHRRGLFKKCKNNNNQLTPYTYKDGTIDISSLFDFSDETNSDKDLKTGTWTVQMDQNQKNIAKFFVGVTKQSTTTSQEVCKVVGFKENIDSNKLSTSQADIKTTLERKVNPNDDKETARENFLNRCRRTWNNTIKLELVENGNKYSLKDLDDIFR